MHGSLNIKYPCCAELNSGAGGQLTIEHDIHKQTAAVGYKNFKRKRPSSGAWRSENNNDLITISVAVNMRSVKARSNFHVSMCHL